MESVRNNFKISVCQFSCCDDYSINVDKAISMVKKAADNGCNLILLQELFSSLYFCQDELPKHFDLALPGEIKNNKLLKRMSKIAKENNIIIPVSFFEKRNHVYFNSIIVFDADGTIIGIPKGGSELDAIYRKVHIPTGPGYEEKFYFSPAPLEGGGFKIFHSNCFNVSIGIGICWDQWFPETSRILSLMGAEILLFPTAIGSEPQDPNIHSKNHWQRTMCGHAASNIVPLIASNRIGKENKITFYGSSFIANNTGEIVKEANETDETLLCYSFNLNQLKLERSSWGLFRDRRPELYTPLITLDGRGSHKTLKSISTNVKIDFTMPGEWEEHKQCWMLWVPNDIDIWNENQLHNARLEYSNVANTISKDESVSVCVSESDYKIAKKYLKNENIQLVTVSHNDSWMRDTGPTFVKNEKTNEIAGIDWIFDGYSNKFQHDKDKYLARNILAMQNIKRFASPLILEGGSIHSDGEGTLLTTEECLLKRNPMLSKTDIEIQLKLYLGVIKILWIPKGVKYDIDTDGHVDNICCFARPGEVILSYPSNPSSNQRKRSETARLYLENERDAKGRKLKIYLLEHPNPIFIKENEVVPKIRELGSQLAASYINFYMTKYSIIMPEFENGNGNDKIAKEQLKNIFPNREIKSISSRGILLGGGNIHCITQQQPL